MRWEDVCRPDRNRRSFFPVGVSAGHALPSRSPAKKPRSGGVVTNVSVSRNPVGSGDETGGLGDHGGFGAGIGTGQRQLNAEMVDDHQVPSEGSQTDIVIEHGGVATAIVRYRQTTHVIEALESQQHELRIINGQIGRQPLETPGLNATRLGNGYQSKLGKVAIISAASFVAGR